MGFRGAWIAFTGIDKRAVLTLVDMTDTNQLVDLMEVPFAIYEAPHGWVILAAKEFEFLTAQLLAEYSANCSIIGVQVHEGIMCSAAYAYSRENHIWSIKHDIYQGRRHLDVDGSPPSDFDEIRSEATKLQDAETEGSEKVDHFFDVPVKVAYTACGFRHDRWKFDWGEPIFTRLTAR